MATPSGHEQRERGVSRAQTVGGPQAELSSPGRKGSAGPACRCSWRESSLGGCHLRGRAAGASAVSPHRDREQTALSPHHRHRPLPHPKRREGCVCSYLQSMHFQPTRQSQRGGLTRADEFGARVKSATAPCSSAKAFHWSRPVFQMATSSAEAKRRRMEEEGSSTSRRGPNLSGLSS
jgi:hypothetical protein